MHLTPDNVTAGSGRRIWWKCKRGHEWEAFIYSRTGGENGHKCPFCTGLYATQENCLHTIKPKIAIEWHPTRNGELTSKDIVWRSTKKVWWKCGKGHEWQATVCARTKNKKNGCTVCNSLFMLNRTISKDWHPLKNGKLTPKDVIPGSGKKVWWKCKHGHEWQAKVYHRANSRSKCPFCSGRNATKQNCLWSKNPTLSKQWHPTKNGDITPKNVTSNSNKKVWWICKDGHEWQCDVAHRNGSRKTGCPYCVGQKACSGNCLLTKNPQLAKEWHPTKNGKLTTKDVTPGSGLRVWWRCKEGHEWRAYISIRSSQKTRCPHCINHYSVRL